MRSRRSIDLEIAAIADRQWGIIHREQLIAAGLSASAIDRLVASRRLRVLHRGVYAVGHRLLRPQAYRLAAVLACGEGAVLSHAAAAAHWELRRTAATRIDVTVPRRSQRRRPGIRVHRHAALLATECTIHDGVPITTPSRTLLDLAATLPRRSVERALDEAERRELFDLTALRAVVRAHRGRPGAPLLAAVLGERPTSPGRGCRSSSRSTATSSTARAASSSAIGRATPCSPPRASSRSASPRCSSRTGRTRSPRRCVRSGRRSIDFDNRRQGSDEPLRSAR